MKKVHTLPPEIISKIAAGEVVERPASVIKELIENALDAKTQTIEIHLKNAGKTLISVKDSGMGIDPDDIETIFNRHTTSKISNLNDLFNIQSLGFRGEALYSIAAICDVTLRSRTKNQETGLQIHLRGGKKLDLRPVAMPCGTHIEVRELFFNTPARRKFLKTDTTELNQILNTVVPYILLHHQCQFLLIHQDRPLIDLKAQDNLRKRVAYALNLEENHCLEVNQHLTDRDTDIRLLLGNINIHRPRRDLQFIFVNNRPVQNKSLSFALNEVYRLLLPSGQYPFFCLYLQLPASEVDVNIHPTKREVKIKDELVITSIIRQICEQTLMTLSPPKEMKDKAPLGQLKDRLSIHRALSETMMAEKAFDDLLPISFEKSLASDTLKPLPTEQYTFPQESYYSLAGEAITQHKQETLRDKLSKAHFIGSFINKFLLYEAHHSLLIIDQHAAQERITFEQLIEQLQKGKVEVQHLLSPYLVKLTPQELLNWEEAKEKLDQIGFNSTLFDKETVAVHTYPVLLKDPAQSFHDILSGGSVILCDHETIARRACRCSIMAGDFLKAEQAEYLRDQLTQCRDPFTCPHGRPTVVEMTESFLDKQFLRK